MKALGQIWCTSYCNRGHLLADGRPVDHECNILPPAALAAERDGNTARSIELIEAMPRRPHRGVPLPPPFAVGQRVQLHPGCDRWMMGDRFGAVAKVGRKWIHVKLDKSGLTKRFAPWRLNPA